jgi:hypothetical protein
MGILAKISERFVGGKKRNVCIAGVCTGKIYRVLGKLVQIILSHYVDASKCTGLNTKSYSSGRLIFQAAQVLQLYILLSHKLLYRSHVHSVTSLSPILCQFSHIYCSSKAVSRDLKCSG